MNRICRLGLLAALMVFLSVQFSLAQDRTKGFTQQEIIDELQPTTKIEKVDKAFQYDFGAWVRIAPYWFDDPDRNRTMISVDTRGWFRSTIKQNHEVYYRFKTTSVDFGKGDSYILAPKYDGKYTIKPATDQIFYRVNVTEAFLKGGNHPGMMLQLGRQYAVLGSGLVYNRVDDSVRFELDSASFKGSIMSARTPINTIDIDQTRLNPDHSNRSFIGLQVDYKELGSHQPYFVTLIQKDHNKENDTLQKYRYNSNYVGVGINGSIIPRLEYGAEFVNETGTSYGANTTSGTDKISARAAILQLRYLPKVKSEPIFTLRHMAGSGDNNRFNVNGTKGGNKSKTQDNAFQYFGYTLTGYAVEPKLSNLVVTNLAVSAKPIKGVDYFEDTELGVAYYIFSKIKKDGAISDLNANVSKTDVGKELDFFANWKILSDCTFSLHYGSFTPGAAYPAKIKKINFCNLNFTYSF